MWNSKFFPGNNTPSLSFRGEKSLFSFSENVPKLSYCNSNAEFKDFPGNKTPDLHFMGEESLFPFSENVLKFSYSNTEFKNFPGNNKRKCVSVL